MGHHCPFYTKHIKLASLPLLALPRCLDNVWNRFLTSIKGYIMNIDLNIKINYTVPHSRKLFPCALKKNSQGGGIIYCRPIIMLPHHLSAVALKPVTHSLKISKIGRISTIPPDYLA